MAHHATLSAERFMGVCSNCHLGQTLLTLISPLLLDSTQTPFPLLLLSPHWQIYIQSDIRMKGFDVLFQHWAEAKGGRRWGNQLWVLIVLGCVHTLQAFVLKTSAFFSPLISEMWPISNSNMNTKKCQKHCSFVHLFLHLYFRCLSLNLDLTFNI